MQYEGLEASKNIFYIAAPPNQQIIPAVTYLLQKNMKKMYLLGSDYVFPRTANKVIKAQLLAEGGTTVAEDYTPLGNTSRTPSRQSRVAPFTPITPRVLAAVTRQTSSKWPDCRTQYPPRPIRRGR